MNNILFWYINVVFINKIFNFYIYLKKKKRNCLLLELIKWFQKETILKMNRKKYNVYIIVYIKYYLFIIKYNITLNVLLKKNIYLLQGRK